MGWARVTTGTARPGMRLGARPRSKRITGATVDEPDCSTCSDHVGDFNVVGNNGRLPICRAIGKLGYWTGLCSGSVFGNESRAVLVRGTYDDSNGRVPKPLKPTRKKSLGSSKEAGLVCF